MVSRVKTFANTFIYSLKDAETGYDSEQAILKYLMETSKNHTRINKNSDAFTNIANEVKVRQTTAVLYRILMNPNVVLATNTKELPASFKVFKAKDPTSTKKQSFVFIDVTGLITIQNGYFVCKAIDKLCSYLFDALITLLYFDNPTKITNNGNIVKESTICFVRLFTSVMDSFRFVNFEDSRQKVEYITAVYFLYNLVGKDSKYSKASAAAILQIPTKLTSAWDYYYKESDFDNIDTLISMFADVFHYKELTTEVFISKWMTMYYSGTMYATELLPVFLNMMANAYTGAYINNQKLIENICSKDMVILCNDLLKIGGDTYSQGFTYGKGTIDDISSALSKQ